MRIGLLIYGRLDTLSGGYLYDRQLVAQLTASGQRVDVVSLPWRSYGRHLLQNGSRPLRQRLRTADFDLLLQDELNHPSLFALNRWLRPRVAYPIVSVVHHLRSSEAHPRPWRPLYRAVERHYLQRVDGFVFNSQTTRRVVQGLVGDERPFVVAPPGGNRFATVPSAAQIEQRAQQPGALRLLFVGNVTPRKGLHTLIQALDLLPRAGWSLDVVGSTAVDPAYAHHWLHTMPQQRHLAPITAHGALDDAALARLFGRSHLLVVPSQYEGFGIVYLEGMAFGLPAIGSTAGAAHEIIRHGQNGYLVTPHDVPALAGYLQQLMADRALLASLSRSAQRRFAQHPTWQESMETAVAFLQAIVSSGK